MSVSRTPPALALLAALVTAGCGGAPILANEPLTFATPAARTDAPPVPADPVPVAFPRDDGPHDRLTEWWYYTGHLEAADGRRFGFEAVIFRAERGAVPTAWASHLALTDEDGERFLYAQRSEVGPQVDQSPRDAAGTPTAFDLRVAGLVPMAPGGAGGTPSGGGGNSPAAWRLSGSDGNDRIVASLTPSEAAAAGASFGLTLDLRAAKRPALHDNDGFVDFGLAGSSYYYSRTRLAATGQLMLDGEQLAVDGIAWFDHQWGDFVTFGGGGWDWFAINLDDGTDITGSVVFDAAGTPVLEYGTIVSARGAVQHVVRDPSPTGGSFVASSGGVWLSPATGRAYPNEWRLVVGDYAIKLRPTLANQELDTRATTGVVYWEGSQIVEAERDGERIGGEAYVEITRYGP